MELLESAMAFAVVMMIFSTVVTGIVEAILKIVGTREKILKKTIEALYDKAVSPRLSTRLEEVSPYLEQQRGGDAGVLAKSRAWLTLTSTKNPTHKQKFVEALTENPVFEPAKNRFSPERKSQIDRLSLVAFAERLGKTDVGKAIIAEGEAQVELLVQDLVRTFDRFGRAASEVFRKKAQLTAICVAIPFAWFANIDASRLLVQLIENPSIRSSLIEQAGKEYQENQDAVKSLNTLKNNIEKLQTQTNTETESTPSPGTLKQELDDILKQMHESVEKREAQGLAIGWQYYPLCGEGNKDTACDGRVGWMDKHGEQQNVLSIAKTWDFAIWLLMSSLAGVLIGLGGPFWFKVFTGLSKVFQVMRSFSYGGSKPANESLTSPDDIAEKSAKPKDVLDAFKVSVAVNMKANLKDQVPTK